MSRRSDVRTRSKEGSKRVSVRGTRRFIARTNPSAVTLSRFGVNIAKYSCVSARARERTSSVFRLPNLAFPRIARRASSATSSRRSIFIYLPRKLAGLKSICGYSRVLGNTEHLSHLHCRNAELISFVQHESCVRRSKLFPRVRTNFRRHAAIIVSQRVRLYRICIRDARECRDCRPYIR